MLSLHLILKGFEYLLCLVGPGGMDIILFPANSCSSLKAVLNTERHRSNISDTLCQAQNYRCKEFRIRFCYANKK